MQETMSELCSGGGAGVCAEDVPTRQQWKSSDRVTTGLVFILGFRERPHCNLAFFDLAECHLAQRTGLIERPP